MGKLKKQEESLESGMLIDIKNKIFQASKELVEYDKNMILYGPPGTGKTYYSAMYAVAICDGKKLEELTDYAAVMERYEALKKEHRIAVTTFHQSYGYEEFIEGIRPVLKQDSENIGYSLEAGVFKKFCEQAAQKVVRIEELDSEKAWDVVPTEELDSEKIWDIENVEVIQSQEKNYVFIIDEINRGNLSKIFGELITLIEETKREGMPEAASAILPYSGETFSVPANVYLIGTMNTADRSIQFMDTALRRRFHFVEMMPDTNVLRNLGIGQMEFQGTILDVAGMLDVINERIAFLFDREHTIGHAFFTGLKNKPTIEHLASIFEKSVIPLLQEYFYEDYQKIQLVLGDNAKKDPATKFILDKKINLRDLFMGNVEDLVDEKEVKYEINPAAFRNIFAYKTIAKKL